MEIKIDYTLEKHLSKICENDPDYKVLNSVWVLNKEKLTIGLNAVSSSFPHYSMHDASHSKTIIKNIESLLGEDRISTLGATETFLLLMSSYTHDIGMVLFYEVIEGEWQKPEFKDYLKWLIESSPDDDLVAAAKRLFDPKTYDPENCAEWALKVKDDVIVISADYFRSKHHERSRDYLRKDSSFRKLADNFYSEQLPSRFVELLSQIAYGHGVDFEKTISPLAYKANGLKSDKIHPKFIACMIRMGDYLDVDDGRFNAFSISTLKEMPKTSDDHKQKHAGVKHLLISPESIEVTVDCPTDSVFREARRWFDGLKKEVQMLSKEWVAVAPKNLGGLPPVILDNKIQILYKGQKAKQELRNLKFAISNERIFDMLEGGALYDDAQFVFLREMVQNAMDASKIQLWRDILDGRHDLVLLPHLMKQYGKDKKEDVSIADIRFPDDIPDDIYEFYPIDLHIEWVDDKFDTIEIRCIDKGTGISDNDLIRMTSHVGESRKADTEFRKFKEGMPFWLKPTGAFGVGLQSLFLVTEEFKIQTKSENESTAKEIVFRSAKRNAYCSVNEISADEKCEDTKEIKRGSTIIMQIKKEKFAEGTSFSYDYFTDTRGGTYPHLIYDYIIKEFRYVDNLNIHFLDEGIIKVNKEEEKDNWVKVTKETVKVKNDFRIDIYQNDTNIMFKVMEIDWGSELKLTFTSEFSMINRHEYLIRDIPVESYRNHDYFYLQWNLMNNDSDKLVNLSRNKLLNKRKSETKKKLNNLLSRIILHIYKLAIDKELIKNEKKQICYFNIILSLLSYSKDKISEIDIRSLGNLALPKKEIKTPENKAIKASDFFKLNKVLDASQIFDSNLNTKIKEYATETDAIIFDSYYNRYSNEDLQVVKYIPGASSYINIRVLERADTNKYLMTTIEANLYYYLRHNLWGRRLYALELYKNLAIKESKIYHSPDYSKHNIISPFKDRVQLNSFIEEMNKLPQDIEYRKHIRQNMIDDYINQRIIDYILDPQNRTATEEITAESIKDDYSRLLADIYISYKEYQKEEALKEEERTKLIEAEKAKQEEVQVVAAKPAEKTKEAKPKTPKKTLDKGGSKK